MSLFRPFFGLFLVCLNFLELFSGKDGNLEYENLEPRKRQSRINLESYWGVFGCVCGVEVVGGGEGCVGGGGGMIIGDAMS